MGKRTGRGRKKDATARPFKEGERMAKPRTRTMKQKQKSWILAGLRALKAPMASQFNLGFTDFDSKPGN